MRDTDTGETVKLDAAQGVTEPGTGSARFQTASSDGSRVFFTDRQKLTPDSTAEAFPTKPDLYECEMVVAGGKLSCRLTDLTVDQNPGEHANVQGLLFGTSQDGTSTYFVAQGLLASNENGNHKRRSRARTTCMRRISTAASGRERSSRRSPAKTIPSGKASTSRTWRS